MAAKTPAGGMTDEERLALAAKLDRELDEFIDGLEKKRYEDGWPEDRWEEEMDKHPFFMKQAPGENEAVSPLVEGLQRLKYDPEENLPDELALNYKEDGNFNFKHKNYRMAIISYTEGIKAKGEDVEINASLYNNRSACHFFLGNYRSSLNDCKRALEHSPNHLKACIRAAECALKLKEHDVCNEYCDKALSMDKDNVTAVRLKKDSVQGKAEFQRDQRKKAHLEKKKTQKEKDIIEAVTLRGINIEKGANSDVSLSNLEPSFPGIVDSIVHWDASSTQLIWPVLFLYPEYQTTDIIQNFEETTKLGDHLAEMFQTPPEWDKDGVYLNGNLNVYYEGRGKYSLHRVGDINKTLLEIMKEDRFELRAGTPAFIIFVMDSRVEKSFVKSYS